MELRRPDVLDTAKHDRALFNCGNVELGEWLRRYAGQNRTKNHAAVWVIADEAYRIVCYASLSMTSVDKSAAPDRLGRGGPSQIPALLIGRLATDVSVAGFGVGSAMVHHILLTAVDLNRKAACRAVVVHALDDNAWRWWQRFGFIPFDPADPTNPALYLLTEDVEATLAAD
jgi:hypothetical protein